MSYTFPVRLIYKVLFFCLKVQEALQPMQQVMSEAENILATEPKVGFNIGQAKEELIKVNVCILAENLYCVSFFL